MPYFTNDDLPISIQRHLPEHGQDIFREAFNHAGEQYADDPRQDEMLFRAPRDSFLEHLQKDDPLDTDRRKTAQQEHEMNA